MQKRTRTRNPDLSIAESEVYVTGKSQSLIIKATEGGGLLIQLIDDNSNWRSTLRLDMDTALGLRDEMAWMLPTDPTK